MYFVRNVSQQHCIYLAYVILMISMERYYLIDLLLLQIQY